MLPSTKQSKIGAVILAAGASTRMGRPKQLLQFRDQTLLQNAVNTALTSLCDPVVVVVGAHSDLVKNEFKDFSITLAENCAWETGMGSSIRVGLEKLLALNARIEGVVIMLCDQPFVTPAVINGLIEIQQNTGSSIVASEYGNTHGVPAFFSRHLFSEIALLKSSEGARKIIAGHTHDLATFDFAEGAIDIDTPQDYNSLPK